MKKLPRSFYTQDTILVANNLLGKYLVHSKNNRKYIGKIVEVEAYLGAHDLASHSSKGYTDRTKIMFGPAGYAYIYMIYGMYYCMNVVTESIDHGSAVLIRALEPIQNVKDRTHGPGLLCKAMHITKEQNGLDLTSKQLYICSDQESSPIKIIKSKRIGVDYAKSWAKRHLRFYIANNPHVSKR